MFSQPISGFVNRVMLDDDDEVRDRAAFYHWILSTGDRALMKEYVLNDEIRLNMQTLERALANYIQSSSADQVRPFDLSSMPVEELPANGISEAEAMADSSTSGFFEPLIGPGIATGPGAVAAGKGSL